MKTNLKDVSRMCAMTLGLLPAAAFAQTLEDSYKSAEDLVKEAKSENAAPQAVPAGIPESWKTPLEKDLEILVTERDGIFVWEKDAAGEPANLKLPTKDWLIRQALPLPGGSGVLLLADDISHLDFASQILWLDLRSNSFHKVFDTLEDQWGKKRLLRDAAIRAKVKKEGYVDNDLTEMYFDSVGSLCFTNEDDITFRATLENGQVAGLEVPEGIPARASEYLKKEKVDGREGWRLSLSKAPAKTERQSPHNGDCR